MLTGPVRKRGGTGSQNSFGDVKATLSEGVLDLLTVVIDLALAVVSVDVGVDVACLCFFTSKYLVAAGRAKFNERRRVRATTSTVLLGWETGVGASAVYVV